MTSNDYDNDYDNIKKAIELLKNHSDNSCDINYIYTISYEELITKIKEIYNYVLELQKLLITKFNIKTKIITTKINVDIDPLTNKYKFNIVNETNIYNIPSYDIKLVFDTTYYQTCSYKLIFCIHYYRRI
jgi:hypothetical protein